MINYGFASSLDWHAASQRNGKPGMNPMRFLFSSVLLLVAIAAHAIDSSGPPPVEMEAIPEQPDIPGPVESGEVMEPDITILRKGEETQEEYRINGKLYMIKITPKIGPPYYMKDTDGDGNLDSRSYELVRSMDVPSWVLLSW